MTIAKGLSVVVACLWIVPLAGVAQEAQSNAVPSEAAIEERRQELISRLNLTAEQVDAVMPILDESRQRIEAITASYRAEGERPSRAEMRQMRGEVQIVRDETRTALSQHLTPEQLAAFEELQGERRQSLRERMRERRSL